MHPDLPLKTLDYMLALSNGCLSWPSLLPTSLSCNIFYTGSIDVHVHLNFYRLIRLTYTCLNK